MPTSARKAGRPVRGAKAVGRGPRAVRKLAPDEHSPLGKQIIEGLGELLGTLQAGGMAAVEKKFTVHRVRKVSFAKPALGKADVVAIRTTLGASQTVFASLLGVSPATVRAWEQGVNSPSGIALRFLAEVRANPTYWKARLKEVASS